MTSKKLKYKDLEAKVEDLEKSLSSLGNLVNVAFNIDSIMDLNNSDIISNTFKNFNSLKEKEQQYREVFDNLNDCVFIIEVEPNDKFRISLINPSEAAALNLKKEDVEGKYVDELLTEEIANYILFKYKHVVNTGKIYTYDEEFEFMDKVYYSTTLVPMKNEDGKIHRIIGVSRDITDRKKLEISLKESQNNLKDSIATKDKFFSIIAHDLRSPLGNFMNVSELLSTSFDEFNDEERKEYLELIRISSKNIYTLLENLLDWSKSQQGLMQFNPEYFSLRTVAETVIQNLRINSDLKYITVDNSIKKSLIILADVNMIKTIIRNLLSNAIKFSPENGKININAVMDAKEVVFSLQDSGIGITKDRIENIFNLNDLKIVPSSSKSYGTGLGLILCKEFVDRHQGKIWVESQPGSGSKFLFSIPAG